MLKKIITVGGSAAIGTFGLFGQNYPMPPDMAVNQDMRDSIEASVENGDYEAWKELHSQNNLILQTIDTESEFQLLVEAHNAKADGNLEKAHEIMQELGFPNGMMNRRMGIGSWNQLDKGNIEVLDKLMMEKDYNSWVDFVSQEEKGARILDTIDSEEKFIKFADMHIAMRQGDITTATSLRNELGLERPLGRNHNKLGM